MPEVTTLTDFGAFVNEAQFAKVVVGPGNEEMLLVNGKVYRVIGPEGPCADFFASALRQMTPTSQPIGILGPCNTSLQNVAQGAISVADFARAHTGQGPHGIG